MKGKYLITTDNWFIAPDGKSYRAVWGEAHTMTAAEALGVEPNRNSANWMVRVGTEEHHIILAGCQIHYAVSCPYKPFTGSTKQKAYNSNELIEKYCEIYIPEAPEAPEDMGEIADKHPVNLEDDGWHDDETGLLSILIDLSRDYFDDPSERTDVLDSVRRGNMAKYRFERPPFKNNRVLEIVWTTGYHEIFSFTP